MFKTRRRWRLEHFVDHIALVLAQGSSGIPEIGFV